ncbi:hypothetical protein M8J76_008234 [Diaphorina citri]|nr:hypothetical protein M8J76_008234 [Diaphorina citri]
MMVLMVKKYDGIDGKKYDGIDGKKYVGIDGKKYDYIDEDDDNGDVGNENYDGGDDDTNDIDDVSNHTNDIVDYGSDPHKSESMREVTPSLLTKHTRNSSCGYFWKDGGSVRLRPDLVCDVIIENVSAEDAHCTR